MNIELNEFELSLIIESLEFASSDNIIDYKEADNLLERLHEIQCPGYKDMRAREEQLKAELHKLRDAYKKKAINTLSNIKTNEENMNASYILKYLDQEQFGDRWGSWTEDKFVDYVLKENVNDFNTAEEAVNYVRTHLDEFPTKVYLFDVKNNRIRKIKKHV